MFKALLTIIFIRPFISLIGFPHENFTYTTVIFGFLALWFIVKGVRVQNVRSAGYAVLPLLIALVISLATSPDKAAALQELYANHYVSGMLFFLIAVSLNPQQRKKVLLCILVSALAISLGALHQYFFGFKRLLNYLTLQGISDVSALAFIAQKRVFFPFVTPNTLAGYLAMIIPLCLTGKKFYWFALPLIIAFALTKSLGALLGLVAALAAYFYFRGSLRKNKLFVFLALLLLVGTLVSVRMQAHTRQLRPGFSSFMRLNYLQETMKIIKKAPLAGVGLGNFDTPRSRYAHNSYLQVWAEMGLPGILALLWLMVTVMRSGIKKLRAATGSERIYLAGLAAANIAFLAHNLIDFTFFLPEISIIWWLIMGLLI